MRENDSGLYAAFMAKDVRFDGRFFVGISSTGIYCRPVCGAKRAQAAHCAFYATAAEAERAGYRPCLLCRPELAPGSAITDAAAALVRRAGRMLEAHCGSGESLVKIAGRLGYTDRHLRRVFTAEYRVSPIQYLQTCRLLLAKNLLTDTDLSVLDVAMASGFGSLRRFNGLFRKHYRLTPTALRKRAATDERRGRGITLHSGYRPPYRWDEMLRFLAGRAIPGVEVVENGEYRRTVRVAGAHGKTAWGWVRVGHAPRMNALAVTMDEALLPVLPQVMAKIRKLFDLHCDPAAVHEALAPMNEIRPGLCVPGIRLPGCFDAFEMAVRAVLGQQITVKAATTLAGRMAAALGAPLRTGLDGLTRVFPSPEEILALEGPIETHLGPLGVIGTRARTIHGLAGALAKGEIDLDVCARPETEMRKLRTIPGIGNWTAHYIAMRTLEWTDAFLETDVGVKKALRLRSPKALLHMAEAWRPWRSYATINLWNSL